MSEEIAAGEDSVLIIDDDATTVQILTKALSKTGYRLLTARSGEEGLRIAEQQYPSLILLDIVMPGLSGFEVCRLLKENPKTSHIAVIFLSALENSESKVTGFSVGGVDYISKPPQYDEVLARVRTHVRIQRLERELARRNLELEEDNRQILKAVGEAILATNDAGMVTSLNPAAVDLLGWGIEEAVGRSLVDLKLFQISSHISDQGGSLLPVGRRISNQQDLVRCRNGELIPVMISSAPRAEGGAVLVLRDIREWLDSEEQLRRTREELEQQRQQLSHMERLSTSGELASGIAHEVNQPLTAVVNYAQVARSLLDTDLAENGDKLRSVVEKLEAQAVRASEVLDNLRGFIKKPDAKRSLVDVNELIRRVIVLAEVDSRVNDVAVHLSLSPAIPMVLANPVQLQQVVLNLIRNAIESMFDVQSTEHDVEVDTRCEEEQVKISVIDQGCGLSDQAAERLFDPFYSTKPDGMGIGLTICESIVRDHGGKLEWHRGEQGGTVFTCTLPAASSA